MKNESFFTLVTGASQGIGRALSFEYAHRGNNIFIVALPHPDLEELANEIANKYGVQAIAFGINLTDEDAPEKIRQFASEKGIKVNRLINNAGIGTSGKFENISIGMMRYIMKLNNQALVGIIHFFLKDLQENSPSEIINLSSMEATLPLPYKSIYTASKNFIFSFSLSLSEELKNDNISVTVVCPGSVVTNEDGMRRIKAMGWKAKIMAKMPADVAKIIADKAGRRKRVIIPGLVPKLIIYIMYFIPLPLKMRILEKLFRPYKDHIPLDATKTQ